MATIEQRIEHLFPSNTREKSSPIATVAIIFAERRGQWLTHADVIRLINKRFADSTVLKAFKELSRPLAALNGYRFIDIESIKKEGRGGPTARGRLSDAALEKIFTLVTPVYQKPTSLFIGRNRLELPPLQIGDKYLSPADIISLRNQKSGEEYTRSLLNKMASDIPGADKEAMQKVIEKMAEQQGIEFNAIADQFTKKGQVVFPDVDLARAHFKWKYHLHDKDEPYTRADDVLKTHRIGPIPLHQRVFTELSMRELASDENQAAVSVSAYIVNSQEDERIRALEKQALMGDQAAFDQLVHALSSDPSEDARREAASSLGRMHDARVIEPLIKAMLNDEYNFVRGIAADELGNIGDLQVASSLKEAFNDPDSAVREMAKKALEKIEKKRAGSTLP